MTPTSLAGLSVHSGSRLLSFFFFASIAFTRYNQTRCKSLLSCIWSLFGFFNNDSYQVKSINMCAILTSRFTWNPYKSKERSMIYVRMQIIPKILNTWKCTAADFNSHFCIINSCHHPEQRIIANAFYPSILKNTQYAWPWLHSIRSHY